MFNKITKILLNISFEKMYAGIELWEKKTDHLPKFVLPSGTEFNNTNDFSDPKATLTSFNIVASGKGMDCHIWVTASACTRSLFPQEPGRKMNRLLPPPGPTGPHTCPLYTARSE